MDGIIVDTAEAHYQSWKKIAYSWGFEFSRAANQPLKGASRMHSLELLLEMLGVEKTNAEKEVICALKNDYYLASISELTKADVLPGVLNLLQELRSQSIKTALGSASRNAKRILQILELDHLFDAQVDGNDVHEGKPNPEVFQLAAARLHIAPERCLVIEDAAKGITAAKRAGMHTVGVGNPEELKGADLVLSTLEDMPWKSICTLLDKEGTETQAEREKLH
ncbi:MAG: beta-phosphoglucomutase [Saprospiraceae bacterium]|nr:beta-phosphoglucomutase [Saprospiraceae bacterium]